MGVGERVSNSNLRTSEKCQDFRFIDQLGNVRWCTGARWRASEPSGNISTRINVDVLDNKYQIEQLLGQDGMGAVSRATHLGTKRTVAVKVIHPQLSAYDQFMARFRREAEAAGRLRHPMLLTLPTSDSRRLLSEAVWFQLLDVGRLCFLSVVECVRHASDGDKAV